jgi:hypothetical protein
LNWLRDPSQIKTDRLNTLQREARRHFRDKMRIYLKTKIKELQETKICKYILNLFIGLNNLRKFTSLEVNLFPDENGGKLADYYSILNRWKKKISLNY